MNTIIPVKYAKARIRIGGEYRTCILTEEKHGTYLGLYRGEICLYALVWKNEFGYPGKGKKKLRIRPENYGLGSSTGFYDKDILQFRTDGKTLKGKLVFRMENVINDEDPWEILGEDGNIYRLKMVSPGVLLGSELSGESLDISPAPPAKTRKETRKYVSEATARSREEREEEVSETIPETDEHHVSEESEPDTASSDDALPVSKPESPDGQIEPPAFSQGEQMSMAECFTSESKEEAETKPDSCQDERYGSSGKHFVIYTDGSSLTNPGPCGGAYVMLLDGLPIGQSLIPIGQGTNNIAELTAVIRALRDVKSFNPESVTIVSDSQYVVKGVTEWSLSWINNGWLTSSGKEVQNAGLWKELLAENEELNAEFRWVRGHNGDQYNEMVDGLAVEAARKSLETN